MYTASVANIYISTCMSTVQLIYFTFLFISFWFPCRVLTTLISQLYLNHMLLIRSMLIFGSHYILHAMVHLLYQWLIYLEDGLLFLLLLLTLVYSILSWAPYTQTLYFYWCTIQAHMFIGWFQLWIRQNYYLLL